MSTKTKPTPLSLLQAAEAAEHWLTEEAASENPGATKPCDIIRVLRAAIRAHKPPHIVITVLGGVAEVVEEKSTGKYTYELRDYDNCSECGGVDCEGGHKAVEVHGHLTGENQAVVGEGQAMLTNADLAKLTRQRSCLNNALAMYLGFLSTGADEDARKQRLAAIEYADALIEMLISFSGGKRKNSNRPALDTDNTSC